MTSHPFEPTPGRIRAVRTLRIAILGTKGIPANYGGFETFAEQLATRLVTRGHEVTVYAEAPELPAVDTYYRGVRVRYRLRPRWGVASVLAFDIACLWDARKRYDLVYMLGYGAAWACWLPRLYGSPVWINVDGLEWARSKWGAGARFYLRCMEWVSSRVATRILADSQAIADRFRRLYPSGAQCSFIAYGADEVCVTEVDPAVLAVWGLKPGCYFLVVARPERENHVLEIIQGYLRHAGDWPLVIVGNVSGINSYQRELLTLSSRKVIFVGGIYDAEQLKCLRVNAACYLHGHSVGGTNPSLLEALACGNWVIAHDNPFNREVARDAAHYFNCPEELAQCLDRWVSMTEYERHQCHSGARRIVAEHYTWGRIVDAYEALMRSECRTEDSVDGGGD